MGARPRLSFQNDVEDKSLDVVYKYKAQMSNLKEKVILRKLYLYFLGPSLAVGIIGLFLPLFYVLVPAHESSQCICKLSSGLIPIKNFTLLVINTLVFYTVNWVFLLLLCLMLHRIRHIKDKLQIREEMGYQIGVLTFFDVLQYFFFLCD
jgi:hypothetical protein